MLKIYYDTPTTTNLSKGLVLGLKQKRHLCGIIITIISKEIKRPKWNKIWIRCLFISRNLICAYIPMLSLTQNYLCTKIISSLQHNDFWSLQKYFGTFFNLEKQCSLALDESFRAMTGPKQIIVFLGYLSFHSSCPIVIEILRLYLTFLPFINN